MNNNNKNRKIELNIQIEIIKDYCNNIAITEIAKKYNIAYNTVRNIIKRKSNKKYLVEIEKENQTSIIKAFKQNNKKINAIINNFIEELHTNKNKLDKSSLYSIASTLESLTRNQINIIKQENELKKTKLELKRLQIEVLKLKKELNNKDNENINKNDNAIISDFYNLLKDKAVDLTKK